MREKSSPYRSSSVMRRRSLLAFFFLFSGLGLGIMLPTVDDRFAPLFR